MTATTPATRPAKLAPRLAHALLALLALVGLADAAYLTHVKWSFAANPSYDGGMCGLGGGCDQLQHSAMADIAGLPISLLGVGFYVAFLGVLAVRMRARDVATQSAARRLHVLSALLANVYSIILLTYSLSVGLFCPFCGVLYGVNLALLIVSALSLTEGVAPAIQASFKALTTRAGVVAAAAFVLTVAVGFAVYSATLPPPPKFVDPIADPSKPRHGFDVAGRPSRGPEDAPVQIVEFADFECPHCRGLFHTLETVLATRADKVHLTFMHFPLDNACNRAVPVEFHKRACELARFGECATKQGKFFEAAKVLFDEGPQTARAALIDRMAGLGLDRPKLEQCLDAPETIAAVKKDIEAGLKAGVEGTPAVYVDGVEAGGARPREFFEQLIDKHLSDPPGGGASQKPDGAARNP